MRLLTHVLLNLTHFLQSWITPLNNTLSLSPHLTLTPTPTPTPTSTRSGVLNNFLPDVYVYTDHNKGAAAGASPGFGISLVATSTSGCFYGAQRCTGHARGTNDALAETASGRHAPVPVPEDVGRAVAAQLLDEIERGGCVDANVQPLIFTLMALGPEYVSRVPAGALSPAGIETLRLLRTFFGITFKLKPEAQKAAPTQVLLEPEVPTKGGKSGGGEKRGRSDAPAPLLVPRALMSAKDSAGGHSGNTILLSCLGIGFKNHAKRVT